MTYPTEAPAHAEDKGARELVNPRVMLGVYRHYKGGHYRVLMSVKDAAYDAHDGRTMVVYVSMTTGAAFVRPEEEFLGDVTGPCGYGGPRFRLVAVP